MYPILFEVGPLTIYTLGLLWALGAFAGLWILRLELKRYRYDPETAASVVFAAAVAGLLGALFWRNGKVFLTRPYSLFLAALVSVGTEV